MQSLANENYEDGDGDDQCVAKLIKKFSSDSVPPRSRPSFTTKSPTDSVGRKSLTNYSFAGPYKSSTETELEKLRADLSQGGALLDDAAVGQAECGNLASIPELGEGGCAKTTTLDELVKGSCDGGSTASPDLIETIAKYQLRSTPSRSASLKSASRTGQRCPSPHPVRLVRPTPVKPAPTLSPSVASPAKYLSAGEGKLVLSRKTTDILNYFHDVHLITVADNPTGVNGVQVVIEKPVADYFLTVPGNSDDTTVGVPDDSGLVSASPTTLTSHDHRLNTASTTSSFDMLDNGHRTLAYVKFLVKYTNFEVQKDWLDRLLTDSSGLEVTEMTEYIQSHHLQKTLDLYYAGQRKSRRLAVCRPQNLGLSAKKFRRKLFNPREYRHRKALWHCLESERTVKLDGKHGYEIHACPAMLDVTSGAPDLAESNRALDGSTRKNVNEASDLTGALLRDEIWDQVKWTANGPEVESLIEDAKIYTQSLEVDRVFDLKSTHYQNLVDAVELLSTAKLPMDQHTAEIFAEIMVHFAGACLDFWTKEKIIAITSLDSGNTCLMEDQLDTVDERKKVLPAPRLGLGGPPPLPETSPEALPLYSELILNKKVTRMEMLDADDGVDLVTRLTRDIDSSLLGEFELVGRVIQTEHTMPDPLTLFANSVSQKPELGLDVEASKSYRKSINGLMKEIKDFKFAKSLSGDLAHGAEMVLPRRVSPGGSFSGKGVRKPSISPRSINGPSKIVSFKDDLPAGSFVSVGPAIRSYAEVVSESPCPSAKSSLESAVSEDRGRKRNRDGCIRILTEGDRKSTLKDVSSAQELMDRGPYCRIDGDLIFLDEDKHGDSFLPDVTVRTVQQQKLNESLMEDALHVRVLTELGTWV